MNLLMSACKQPQLPLANFQGGLSFQGGLNIESSRPWRWKDKVVVVMGATGTGKSRLAIDLATRFSAEVVNSDKMQVYKGLDIVTNKVTEEECFGIPHHLLGLVEPDSEFTATDFTHQASMIVDSIVDRDRVPIIAGGSNSYIAALVNDCAYFRSKYECCFLWVNVSLPVLHSFVSDRVDKMIDAGLVNEVRQMFSPTGDYSRGLRRAIGVPELDRFFRSEWMEIGEEQQERLLQEAIVEIKHNTCNLARCQLEKIRKLQYKGWNLNRIDATGVFLKHGKDADEAWDLLVTGPATRIVDQFLHGDQLDFNVPNSAASVPTPMAVVAAATRSGGGRLFSTRRAVRNKIHVANWRLFRLL